MYKSLHDHQIAYFIVLSVVFVGCQQQQSGTTFDPEITAQISGIFSYDIALRLKAIHRNDWTRGPDGDSDNKTMLKGRLTDVSLNAVVFYSQGENLETTAFKSSWAPGGLITINVPKHATIEGYDITGTGYVFDDKDQCIDHINFSAAFRH